MELGTVFKLSLYGLIAVVGVILGAAESEGAASGHIRAELFLPFFSVPVVIGGYLFTERAGAGKKQAGRGLSALLANSLGIIALIATAYEFNSENREGKLLAGTHLLLYATWIVLFQRKTVRSYWFLMALGILQLAIASVLTRSGWFGFSAVAYMFGAVWTLSIFSLWRAEQLFEEDTQRRKQKAIEDHADFYGASVTTRLPVSEVRSSVHHEDGTRWLTARFVSGVLTTTGSALVVSSAFFAFIPRVWVGPDISYQDDHTPPTVLTPKVGLVTSIKLGDLGPMLESAETVFEIQLTNLRTKRPMTVESYAEQLGMAEPLFRGGVMTKYDRGRWSTEGEGEFQARMNPRSDRAFPVLQQIRLEQSNTYLLFCIGKPSKVVDARDSAIGFLNRSTGVLVRNQTGTIDYSVFSTLPDTHSNYHWRVSRETFERYKDRRVRYLERNTYLPEKLANLKKLAGEIVEKETLRRNRAEGNSIPRELTSFEIAEAMESFLQHDYRYSLDVSIQDPSIDPIEDFLFLRKTGHCEYFATALTLMLRAVNIPARIVSGYKGGIEHLDKRNFSFEVQQRFSHVWVEAWLDDDELSWTTFDPTPADARASSLAGAIPKRSSVWTGMQSTLSGLWSENVLNMSLARQEESIYKPLRELAYSLGTFFHQLFTSPRSALDTLIELVKNREQWLSVGGGLFVFGLLLFLCLVVWLIRFCVRATYRWWNERANRLKLQHRRVVAFYERFTKLMKSRGLKRTSAQTQREFAEQIATEYRPALSTQGLENFPQRVSQLFYRVRFGEEQLSTDEVDQLEQDLDKLEHAIAINGSGH